MKNTPLILILCVLTACNFFYQEKHRKSFDQLLENYFQGSLELYRINATFMGDDRYNDTLPDFLSDAFKAKEREFLSSYIDSLFHYEDQYLSPDELMSKKILIRDLELELKGTTFYKDLMPIDQMWTFHLTIGQLASGKGAQPFVTAQDYWNWLIRLEGYLQWMSSAEEKMKLGMEKGYVLPKSLIEKVIPQLAAMTGLEVSSHLFYNPIKNLPDGLTQEEKMELTAAYERMIGDKIIPAYQKLHDFMAGPYYEAGRETSGYASFPDGEAYYKHAIQVYTTTDMSANEIHQLGLKEVARIRGEMKKVMEEVGFKGTLLEFFEHVRSSKELMPFDSPEQVIENFNVMYEKMKPYVDQLFDLQPKTPFEIRRVEAFREKSAAAHYNRGSLDGTRPGIFYIPIPNVQQYNVFDNEALFLHEAIPGHHFQISIQQENQNLPNFRKNSFYSAFSEGWALYTESLGMELGLYEDPYQYFGMLNMEMHRAIRLVVDTGLHAKGWTREQSIAYSLENEGDSEAKLTAEIERYMANPAQALSYKIGQMKIRELRNLAEEKMGERFDIRTFHRKVLEDGAIPLSILEEKILSWISE